MINPNTATNLDTTDQSNFFYGQLKDASTTTAKDGTRINKTLLADIRTVFMRAVKLTGISISGNFDTENSSQLFDACFGTTKVPITTFYNGVVIVTDLDKNPLRVWLESGGKTLRIEGWIKSDITPNVDDEIFLLPIGYRPTKKFNILAMSSVSTGTTASMIYNPVTFKVSQTDNLIENIGINHYINASIPLD